MDAVVLPPELEQFAAAEVAAGRYRDLDEVVRAGITLLRQRAQVRTELLASVVAAQEEGERLGFLTADEVAAHVRLAQPEAGSRRRLGILAGQFSVPADFDAPLPGAVLAAFEGR